MAGRTPHEARKAFLRPLQVAVSCISLAVMLHQDQPGGGLEVVVPSEDPIWVDGGNDRRLAVTLDQQYEVVRADEPSLGPWKVSTRAYRYVIEGEDEELVAWHWHPQSTRKDPHVHVASWQSGDLHIPTGRVSVESVVEFLIRDLGVTARREDWEDILAEARAVFERWRTWP